jgi:1-acyl-sn-glycerol-3-phosphate acyltransferase
VRGCLVVGVSDSVRAAAIRAMPPEVPTTGGAWRHLVGSTLLGWLGWRIEGRLANVPKQVVVIAPHTSNWDFVIGFLVYLALRLEAVWFGKHTLFRGPFGVFLRHFGGIPIHRERAANVVDAYVAEFARRDRMFLALAPEGTRKRAEWKTGFHRIARAANVPIVPAAIDFGRRTVWFFDAMMPTDDVDADVARLRALYAPSMARHPEHFA